MRQIGLGNIHFTCLSVKENLAHLKAAKGANEEGKFQNVLKEVRSHEKYTELIKGGREEVRERKGLLSLI